jgi:hypothetical protein
MTLDPFTTNNDVHTRVATATLNSTGDTSTGAPSTWTPTPGELRGLPAVGRGCGTGAIAETEPGWNLDHWPTP